MEATHTQHTTIWRITASIQQSKQRRMRLSGHCVRHDDEVANKLVLWQPMDGHANRGRQKMTYVDNVLQDTGLGNTSELQTVMLDRGCWKGCVLNAGRPKRQPR